MFRDAQLVAAKDLRIEMRSKVGIGQVVPFAMVVMLLFAFALEPDRGVLQRAGGGLFWIAVLLTSVLTVQRAFAVESFDSLRLSGLDPAGIFLGKTAAVILNLVALEIVLTAALYFLYDVTFHSALTLLVAALLATVAIGSAGTLYGVLSHSLRSRETLLPVLFLPVIAPVMLSAARASDAALLQDTGGGWNWVTMLGVIAAIYTAIGTVAFEPLMEGS